MKIKIFSKETTKMKRISFLMLLSFIAAFLLRLGHEMYVIDHSVVSNVAYLPERDHGSYMNSRNIGTEKIVQRDHTGQSITISQKYEKSASISARSVEFQEDNQTLRAVIENNHVVIQSENLTGLKGQQKLAMVLGVMPEYFDGVVEELKGIGILQDFMINKVDKTAEFMSILAEQETLQKTRASYMAIKDKGETINDLLLIEEKILEVERELQNLGIDLGIYENEGSLCTINITLNETGDKAAKHSPSFVLGCARSSIIWTAIVYLQIFAVIFGMLIVTAVSLKLIISIKRMLENDSRHHDNNQKQV